VPVLTVVLAASLVNDTIDIAVLGLNRSREEFLNASVAGASPYAELAAWSAFTIVVATASVQWTAVFDPMAAGSGIPEMKSIISYDRREEASRYLRARTLVSKVGGLALALGSGVSLGKEGPFVHTSSIIAHRLMKHVKGFRRIYDNDFMRRHVYDAACAVGVTSTFRAPIGGALFAIEVTSTVFMVSVRRALLECENVLALVANAVPAELLACLRGVDQCPTGAGGSVHAASRLGRGVPRDVPHELRGRILLVR
jgi:chloride channel 2